MLLDCLEFVGVEAEVGEDCWCDLGGCHGSGDGCGGVAVAARDDEEGDVAVVGVGAAVFCDCAGEGGVVDAWLGLDDQVGDAGIARRVAEQPHQLRTGDHRGDVAGVGAVSASLRPEISPVL